MFCRSCGSPLSDGAKFCPKCGMQASKTAQNAAQQAARPSVCPQCGTPLSATAKFCPKCGADVLNNARQSVQQTAQQAAQQQPAKPRSLADQFRQGYQRGKQAGDNLLAGKQAKNASQAAQPQYTQQQAAQPQQTAGAGKAAGTVGKKAAKKAGRSALATVAKAAAVGTIGIAVVGGATTVLNNGDGGGGGYTPPADPPGYDQTYNGGGNTEGGGVYTNNPGAGSENTGTYTGGGYTSAQEGRNFTRFWVQTAGLPTEDGEPDLTPGLLGPGHFYIVERDAAAGKAYFWKNRREGEPDSIHSYDPRTGTITLADEDDPGDVVYLHETEDGSLIYGATQIVEVENGSVRAGFYLKMTGLTSEDGVNWTVPATGETFTYDEFGYTSAFDDSLAMRQFSEEFMAWAVANGVTLQYKEGEPETSDYTPPPSVDTSKVTIPDEVMQTYVTYELENIHHEYNGVSVPNHIKMPNAADQKRFEELLEAKLYGPELDFWLANKDSW